MNQLEAALANATSNDRVCPLPEKWNTLWQMLPNRKRKGNSWEPSLPLILAAWHHSSNLDKMLRLKEHIKWAKEHDSLKEIEGYLESLNEEDWHHLHD
jgi:hypothetical protein